MIDWATELFFIGVYFKLPTCEVELMSFSDALSLSNLTHIHNNENLQTILNHLKTDEFVKHDYSDCLRPEYTIPGLIASLLDACNIPANKILYGFQSNNKGNAEEKVIGLMKYVPPLITTRIACQSQWRAYTKFRLLVRALLLLRLTLISTSWCQAPSKAMMGLSLQVRLREHHSKRI